MNGKSVELGDDGLFHASWGRPGAYIGRLGGVLGASIPLKKCWFYLFWGLLPRTHVSGGVLGTTWAVLGAPGARLGAPRARPGASWARPGRVLARPGRVLGPPVGVLGCPGGALGASWGALGASWARPGRVLGRQGASRKQPKSEQGASQELPWEPGQDGRPYFLKMLKKHWFLYCFGASVGTCLSI